MTEKVVDIEHDQVFDDYRYANYQCLCFTDLCPSAIRITQDFRLGKGGILWDASYVMTRYLSLLDLSGKTILELGAGTALPSILCGIKGAVVYATDISPALSLTHLNTANNQGSYTGSVSSLELDWTNQSHRSSVPSSPIDIIVLSDVFYLPVTPTQELAPAFIESLLHFTGATTQVIMTYKYRIPEILDPYLNLLNLHYRLEYLDEVISAFYHNPEVHLAVATLIS